jgi:hypothetical protein
MDFVIAFIIIVFCAYCVVKDKRNVTCTHENSKRDNWQRYSEGTPSYISSIEAEVKDIEMVQEADVDFHDPRNSRRILN